ncbi:MAG TPA: tetratricopeptide repeat protein [Caldimonas sp.]|nr:tetratricopeptide repeat protein [Caldimonas sp.]HEX4232930.1 tetratricopeptide repeat protein [Caldimonas sp.]
MIARDPLAAARARLLQLKADHVAGKLDARRFDEARRVIEHDIGTLLLAADAPAPARPSGRLVGALAFAVLAVAGVGYWKTGAPSLAFSGAPVATADASAAGANGQTGIQQIAAMVDQLAARLQKNPDDAQGWTMLARSYTVLGRFDDALPAYARASELQPNNPQILADYADAVGATKGTANNPQSIALIDRALKADPKHTKALALSGTIAYERGDYTTAIAEWRKIAEGLPPGSELGERVQASIAEARERAGAAGQALPAAGASVAAAAAPSASAAKTTAAASVSGVVSLDPALAAQASPGDTLFVFARPASGGRMPLAVLRKTVKDLPLSFTLDDSMAMSPAAKLSSASLVNVSARISKSGNAIPQPGDLAGEATGVAPGATNIAIRIGSVVGKP